MPYQNIQFDFYTSDHFRLFGKAWIHKDFFPERTIIFHHGLGEHCDRYVRLIEFLEKLKISFFSYDMRGHGRSYGKRGDAENILRLVLDLEEYIYYIKTKYKIPKPFLLGHSLGGLITSYFSIRHTNQEEIQALILSAPALKVSLNILQILKVISGKFLKFFKPDMVLKSEISPRFLSHDLHVVEKYQNDPLVHPFLSIRLGLDILSATEYVQSRAQKLKLPIWIGHGTQDTITSYEGSKEFYEKLHSSQKVFKLYHGLYHEIFNESSFMPLEDLKKWFINFFN